MEEAGIRTPRESECVDAMAWDTTSVEEDQPPSPSRESQNDREYEGYHSVSEHQYAAKQQQIVDVLKQSDSTSAHWLESSQKPIKPKKESLTSRIANVWALSCALNLGLLCESSLKEVVIASSSELDSQSTTDDTEKFSDLEGPNDCEDDASKPAKSIFGSSWPFIDPEQIKEAACRKPIRKRKKKVKWTVKRQKKPLGTRSRIDGATVNFLAKRGISSLLQRSKRENLGGDQSAMLSVRRNPSSRVFDGGQHDERLAESFKSTDDEDDDDSDDDDGDGDGDVDDDNDHDGDEEEVISQTSETSLEKIAPGDYSGSGYSRFCSREEPQNLLNYPDYFMNVLRIDNDTGNNDLDTWEDDTSKDNAQTAKFTKSPERRTSRRKSFKDENAPHSNRTSPRKKKPRLDYNKDYIETPKKEINQKTYSFGQDRRTRNSVYNHYNRQQISRDMEKSLPKRRGRKPGPNKRDVAKKIPAQNPNYKPRRHFKSFDDYFLDNNSKNTSAAIMRDIQECINTKIAKDDKNTEKTCEIEKNIPKTANDKDLGRDISMNEQYDWMDNNEQDLSSQMELSDATIDNVEKSIKFGMANSRGRFDNSQLKMNTEENWEPAEDSNDNDDRIHSSWRRSTLESSTEEYGNEVADGALLLARKIVSDDLTKDEKRDDVCETLNNSCYKEAFDEKSNAPVIAKKNSFHDSDEDMDLASRVNAKNLITYRNKNRKVKRSLDDDFEKDDNAKVHDKSSSKFNSKTSKIQPSSSNSFAFNSNKQKDCPRRITRSLIKTRNLKSREFVTGKLVWGFYSGWWPALIVEADHVGMLPEDGKLWVYWLGDSQISLLKKDTQIEPFSRCLEERLSHDSHKNNRSRAINATIQILRQRFNSCNMIKPYYCWIRRNVPELEILDDLIFYPYPESLREKMDALKERNSVCVRRFAKRQEKVSIKKNMEKFKKASANWEKIEDERLPLHHQHPGVITWAKLCGHNWWPAMIIDYRDSRLKEPSFGCQWIIWYGDFQVSQMRHLEFLKFHKGIERLRDYILSSRKQQYIRGVIQASKEYCSRLGCNTDDWTFDNIFEYFSTYVHNPDTNCSTIYDEFTKAMLLKITDYKVKIDIDVERKEAILASDDLRRVSEGKCKQEDLCLSCLKIFKSKKEQHPFFPGCLCKRCAAGFKPSMFVLGDDNKCFFCSVCGGSGTVITCDTEDCSRVYCTACLKYLICPNSFDCLMSTDPWRCFLCKDSSIPIDTLALKPRDNWKEIFLKMFRSDVLNEMPNGEYEQNNKPKRPVRVLSLFDGLSTGFLVLQKLGIEVEVYYASEIDVNSITISSAHFGDRITHLGDVRGITKEKIQEIAPIDLVIGGSPCNDLSLVNPARLGLHNPKGTGILFFEYCRLKKLVEKANKGRQMFWLFENVASMPTSFRLEINSNLGREPYIIDSADFSAQHRLRLYWHNFPYNPYMPLFECREDVQDKLTPNLNRKALCKKLRTVTGRTGSLLQGKAELKPVLMRGKTDGIWITELEEIFGFPRHYTDVKNLSATNRQKLIGKCWSVQTLTAIMRPICSYFKCNEEKVKETETGMKIAS